MEIQKICDRRSKKHHNANLTRHPCITNKKMVGGNRQIHIHLALAGWASRVWVEETD